MEANFAEVRTRFARDMGLPFSGVLSNERIIYALNEERIRFRDRVFNPSVTLWTFLQQVLTDDHSCRKAVARVLAHRSIAGLPACSARTGGYCQARQKLSLSVIRRLAHGVATDLESTSRAEWLWMRRHVKIVDGSGISMPDTPANQDEFPQHVQQKPGLGFPEARIVMMFSLATGAVVNAAMGRASGKGTGELALFNELRYSLAPGDVLLADRFYSSYPNLIRLKQWEVDVVMRENVLRDRNTGRLTSKRLGHGDYLVRIQKPSTRSKFFSKGAWDKLPDELLVRKVRIPIRNRDGRKDELVVITTLLDRKRYSKDAILELYQQRWNAELDIRSIKTHMHMDVLRCKTPEMIRKEFWTHLLAYNLLRGVMLKAAEAHDKTPRDLSFKGAQQTVIEFAAPLQIASEEARREMVRRMLAAIASHPVANRPGRWEPRAVKRRRIWNWLKVPRTEARQMRCWLR